MNLKEVVSYNKDFITKKIVKEKKLKKDSRVKGKVLLELFDKSSGEKVKEAYTENLIPDLYFYDSFLSSFIHGVMGVGDTRESNNYHFFNYLYLTDYDKPENPKEQRVMGNIIGYAHRNSAYSGDDAIKGTINRAETRYEIVNNKMRINFVFDFPTHAANGTIESIYWAESNPDNKDYFYFGPALYGRESGDTSYGISSSTNPKRYWVINALFPNAREVKFISPTKGWVLADSRNSNITQTSYIQFPDDLKGNWLMMPFDFNTEDIVLWEQVVKLLNSDGEPFINDSSDPVKKYDYLTGACPYIQPDGNLTFIGYYIYSISSENILRIFKWSKVGVLLSFIDINMSQEFKDVDYNVKFNYRSVSSEGIYVDGCLDIIGYTYRTDDLYNESIYSSRWIRIDALGNKISDMNVKPKLGNSNWFIKMGMDSSNIERRARIYYIYRSANKIYLYYNGVQGGTNFCQVITPSGNLLEAYKSSFGLSGASYYTYYNILGTDRWIVRYYARYNDSLLIKNALTSRPIGAHTKLAQPVEKTDANTMKIQYMFEIDLVNYGEDYY